MDNLLFDPTLTAQRKHILDTYFNQNVLEEHKFICPFCKECRDSHQGTFYEGQLHHVGDHYDLSIAGNPFRVMIVGQEYGHGPSHVSMKERSQMVLEQTGLQKGFTNRNPHMRGTTSVLRLLFGISLGDNHADEFLQLPEDSKVHLFDAFSLVNFLLCSAVNKDEGRSGKSTTTMRRNCLVHFKKALEILQPTVMIVQGKSFWNSIQIAFKNINKITNTLYTSEINQMNVMIAVFTHPSTPDNTHNWGRDAKTTYLLNSVVPTIELIHKLIFISSIQRGEFVMSSNNNLAAYSSFSHSEKPQYNYIFEQIRAGLIKQFSPEISYKKVEFDHSAPNRLRIYIDRVRIKGSHYEICFRKNYFEFALHFESTPAISLERRMAFDPHLQELSSQVGRYIKPGPLENRGWMRLWFEREIEPIDQEKIEIYIDQYSKFINVTFPILASLYK